MSTYETAPTKFVVVGGIKFGYRQLGQPDGVPLLLVMGFRGTMDHWDPALINALAATRPLLLIDNAGVGYSEGEVPKSMPAWAAHYLSVLDALGVRQVDVMGYSMGGCVAQLMALNGPPGFVRRLVLCGTTPSSGDGVVTAPLGPFNQLKAATTVDEHKAAFLSIFFVATKSSQAAGLAAWDRILKARPVRLDYVPAAASHRQAIAFAKFMGSKEANTATYSRFHELRIPVLIANGSEDVLLPTENSILMWRMLKHSDAQLHLYPDSGHAFLYQYAEHFANLVNDFLTQPRTSEPVSRL